MANFKLLLIPLLGLILSACGLNSTSSPSSIESSILTEANKQNQTPIPGEIMEKTPDADVIYVKAVLEDTGTWTFQVTVEHPDTGWDDYVNGWDVVTLDGTVLKANPNDPFTRLLLHPHEDEQPFTRSQGAITIPDGVTKVIVRAHDMVDGFGGDEVLVKLGEDSGPGFEVHR